MIFQGNDLSFKIHTDKYMGLFGGLKLPFHGFRRWDWYYAEKFQ